MSTVSYANVAANGSSTSASATNSNGSTSINSPKTEDASPIESQDSAVKVAEKEESAESSDSKDAKPKDLKLAPAPVPKTNAWGSSISNSANSKVDEYKWPTPDQQSEKSQSNKPQKFIKPVTTKWVPINAKVILPSSRSQTQSSNKKSNKKNNKNTKNKKVNGTTNQNKPKKSEKSEKKDDKKDDKREDESLSSDLKELSVKDQINDDKLVEGEAGEEQIMRQESQSPTSQDLSSQDVEINGSSQQQQQQPQQAQYQSQQQYNNRQYNKVNYRSNRYSLPNNQFGNYMQFTPYHHQSLPNNFYSYPQQGMAPYMNSPIPGNYQVYPQQFPIPNIPPPVGAKQDPVSALTQQIDYYFSFENLIKDVFLRKSFDKETGFVNINVILSFKRVQQILNQIKSLNLTQEYDEIIKDSIRNCSNIEINDNEDLNKIEIRVKNDYKKFILD